MRLSVSDVKEGSKSLVQKCTNSFPAFRVRSGTRGEQGGKQRQAQAWGRPPAPGLEEAGDQAGRPPGPGLEEAEIRQGSVM